MGELIEGELRALADRIGYRFVDPTLLERAMAHRSWCSENGGVASNERLEFLGDSVLGVVVTDHIFHRYPQHSEGSLAKVRAAVVNTQVLAEIATEIDIGSAVWLGRGEDLSGGRQKTSILADGLEAVIGAVYLDGGFEPAGRLILALLGSRIETHAAGPGGHDHKTMLQEIAASRFDDVPFYNVSGEGPDHQRIFDAIVAIGGTDHGRGTGATKKQAEQAAARDAWESLQESEHDEIRER
ncbi:MAG: ribonuclease III [Actinomycetia bacterium]|nr:ribonuclease III [Actinomycetes bacterium]